MDLKDVHNLSRILKENGDEVLDASSRLCISSGLLRKLNESFKTIFNLNVNVDNNNVNNNINSNGDTCFHVLPREGSVGIVDQFLDLHLLYDFIQKTIGLKLFSELPREDPSEVNISIFRNLKLLEVRKLSLNLLRGLKTLRAQLEYLICIKTADTLKDVLENCGGDRVQGSIWNELKQIVFSHNGIDDLDSSLEFVPQLSSIDLSHNQIQNADYINCLSNLKYLNLGFNCLASVPSFSGQLCASLRTLILRNNYIDDIKELSVLVNLKELDLSDNCLIDHSQLYPVANLTNLIKIDLNGNPLSYHPLHRNRTAMYLHVKSPGEFLLEKMCLSKSEMRLLGTLYPVQRDLEMSSSTNSINTISTVIPVDGTNVDVEAESSSGTETVKAATLLDPECEGMQDSGFDAGHRVDSPPESIAAPPTTGLRRRLLPAALLLVALLVVAAAALLACGGGRRSSTGRCCCALTPATTTTTTSPTLTNASVSHALDVARRDADPSGSAGSLRSDDDDDDDRGAVRGESDIEILSNPSQSSIEVLSNRSCPRFLRQCSNTIVTQQTVSDPCTRISLKKATSEEMRKSL